MWFLRMALVCALVFAAMPANAGVTKKNFNPLDSTADLLELCAANGSERIDIAAINFCYGYFEGLVHFHKEMNEIFKGKVYCMNEKSRPTRKEAIAMFVKWGKSNTQHHNRIPLEGVLLWAGDAFPCKK